MLSPNAAKRASSLVAAARAGAAIAGEETAATPIASPSRIRMKPPPVIAAEAARGCEDCPASGGEAVLLQQIVKRGAADPEQFRRARDIVLGPAHRLADGLAVGDLARGAKIDRKNVVA